MGLRIEYFCFSGHSGHAFAARNYAKAISQDWNVRIVPLDFGRRRHPIHSDTLRIYHCVPEFYHRFKRSKPSIGFGTFENAEYPAHWKELLEQNDCVLVPSRFNERFCKKLLEIPVYYLPHCLDVHEWNTSAKKYQTIPGRFRFLFFGAWKQRKGCQVLMDAFQQEFASDENVELVIKTNNVTVIKKNFQGFVRAPGSSRAIVSLCEQRIPDKDLPGFFKSFDCFVCPTMGEGFGLPGLQAMAVGTPVVISDHSGCREYANDETAWLLREKKIRQIPRLDDVYQYVGLSWSEISVDELRKTMRNVLDDKMLREEKAAIGASFVRDSFNYQVILDRWNRMMEKQNFFH